ncbi:alpha/beta hydrolase [Fodinicola feengrottensis]|uniref:Alpha/beta hydrolase n=1 Tax=Fodinicola feengrottensis TaxID=435914 RepID=A0ABN2I5A0_9ACTN
MMARTPTQNALAAVELMRDGRFAEMGDMFAPQVRALVTADAIQRGWAAGVDRYGPVVATGMAVSEAAGPGAVVVRIPVRFQHGEVAVVVSVNNAGWLTGIQFAAAEAAQPAAPWEAPEYVDVAEFDEKDVTLGAGEFAVPGTLSLPHRPGPLPAVVLLCGSGPLDRDETIGRNKPFKDLAWGLASRGVAVLRFDKVTYVHGAKLGKVRGFTATDEYVPAAVAAIQLLREHPAIDSARVFVLGHSLGGTVAPRVAHAEKSVAGLVILAGGAQPLHWATVRQITYLASLEPAAAAAAQPAIDAITAQARRVDSPDLSPQTPASDLPFGVSAAYWLDLRDYRPAEVAAGLGKPIFVVQGGRDYQVTVADDLAIWKAGLVGRPDVTIRVYDADNHLFTPGTGRSTPAEYEPVQHMDPEVVADIAGWLS